jgi:hypothetical protein
MILYIILPIIGSAIFSAVGLSIVGNYLNSKQELIFEEEFKSRLTNLDNHRTT